jgi:hypothetical protein
MAQGEGRAVLITEHQADTTPGGLPEAPRTWLGDLVATEHLELVAMVCAGSANAAPAFRHARDLSRRVRRQLEIGTPTSAARTLRGLERELIRVRTEGAAG